MDEFYLRLILSVFFTAVAYTMFPMIRLIINHGKFEEKRAKRISLWNSIVLGTFFCILTTALSDGETQWSAGAAVLYYWINCSLLSKHSVKKLDGSTANESITMSKKNSSETKESSIHSTVSIDGGIYENQDNNSIQGNNVSLDIDNEKRDGIESIRRDDTRGDVSGNAKKKRVCIVSVIMLLLTTIIAVIFMTGVVHRCNYTLVSRVESTCDEKGTIQYKCKKCGESKYTIILPSGHDYVNGVCRNCEYIDLGVWVENNNESAVTLNPVATPVPVTASKDIFLPHEHIYTILEERPATCMEMGSVVSKCFCGTIHRKMSKKLDHILVEGKCKICEMVVFESLKYKGEGASGIKNINLPEGEYYIIGKHYGDSNFIADFYESVSDSYGNLIANKIGKCETIAGIHGPIKNGYINIDKADGEWEFLIVACDTYDDDSLQRTQMYEGMGSKVISNINFPDGNYYITCIYEGESNFVVHFYDSVGATHGKLIANKIGKSESIYGFSGQGKQGYIDVDNKANGKWIIKIEPCE